LTVAYDEHLAERVHAILADTPGVGDLTMFGGWCATVDGKMAVGVLGDDLIVRVGPTAYDAALTLPGVRPFDFTGRPMSGWVYVAGGSVSRYDDLADWVARGVEFARSLPASPRRTRRRTEG
jgi:hypothetical protein